MAPTSIENLILEATRYPDIHLKTLERHLRGKRLELNLYLAVFELYLVQFRSPPPANITSDKAQIYALIGIWRSISDTNRNPTVIRKVVSASPNFWIWIDFLYQQFVAVRNPIDAEDQYHLSTSISAIFTTLYAVLEQTSSAGPEGAIRLAINIYLDLGRRSPAEQDIDIIRRMLKDKAMREGPYTKNAKLLKTWNGLLEGIEYAQAIHADLDASGLFPPKCCQSTCLNEMPEGRLASSSKEV
ncbi:hypothetical protein DXG01_009998 [Tephrocybe rancida]|nr:hypothetical protein DXG01_009998 [Tephrocybe rancida]